MRGMNSASVDLIYLDPPFNSKANYVAPIGSTTAGAEFKDTWTLSDVDVEWINLIESKHPALYRVLGAAMTDNDKSYLAYMAARLLEMRRLLKPTGSIYLHCDPTMSHYLNPVMDAVFGRSNFRNEIVWSYRTGGSSNKNFSKKHDVIFSFLVIAMSNLILSKKNHIPSPRPEKSGIVNYGVGKAEFFEDENGIYNLVNMRDVWEIPHINSQAKERTGYPTQKPLALLRRIITASSSQGDMVLDPFCGCATACIAAEEPGQQWVGIDISPKAAELVVRRMKEELGLFYDGIHRTDSLARTDLGRLTPYCSHAKTLVWSAGRRLRGLRDAL